MNLKIIGVSLEGHALHVPKGLDELLNDGNGWGHKEDNINPNYNRTVKKENGKLITVLSRKQGENK